MLWLGWLWFCQWSCYILKFLTSLHISQSLHRAVDGLIRDSLSAFLFWHIKWMSMNWHQDSVGSTMDFITHSKHLKLQNTFL